jgi:hypothetical protein
MLDPGRQRSLRDPGVTPGVLLPDNPGIVVLWIGDAVHFTRYYHSIKRTSLVQVPALAPVELKLYHAGRLATAPEIAAGLRATLARMVGIAAGEGPRSLGDLGTSVLRAFVLVHSRLPPEVGAAVPWSELIELVVARVGHDIRRMRLEQGIKRAIASGLPT